MSVPVVEIAFGAGNAGGPKFCIITLQCSIAWARKPQIWAKSAQSG